MFKYDYNIYIYTYTYPHYLISSDILTLGLIHQGLHQLHSDRSGPWCGGAGHPKTPENLGKNR